MTNKTSQHILGTAANLLGFCLIVITSLHIAQKSQNSIIDEYASIIALVLTASCLLSFMSIKTQDKKKEFVYEQIADILFFLALAGIFILVLYITISLWST
jgi:hypothetical protein